MPAKTWWFVLPR